MSATEDFLRSVRTTVERLRNPGPHVEMMTETPGGTFITVFRHRHDPPGVTLQVTDGTGWTTRTNMDVPTALKVSDAIRDAIYGGTGI